MFGEKDLIFYAAVEFYKSGKFANPGTPSLEMDTCIANAKKMFEKVFNHEIEE